MSTRFVASATMLVLVTSALACQGPTPATTTLAPAAQDPGIALAGDTLPLAQYRLTVTPEGATLEPLRNAELIGAKFEADLTAAMRGEILLGCPDCFEVTGFRPAGEGEVAVEFTVRHPIPAPDGVSTVGLIANRNDLHVTNVRLVAILEGDTRMFADTGDNSVVVNADQVRNADGYTTLAPIVDVDPGLTANVFPFVTLGDGDSANNGPGNFLPGAGDGAGWELVQSNDPASDPDWPRGFNALAQGGAVVDEMVFDLGVGELANLETNLVLLASYIGAANARPSRLSSQYFLPEGAIQQSPHVEAFALDVPGPNVGDPGQITVEVVDYQQQAEILADPVTALATRDYSKIWSDGRIAEVWVSLGEFIGGTNNFLDPLDQPPALDIDAVEAAPGAGSYADPKTVTIDFANVQGLTGTYRAGVRVSDVRDGRPPLDVPAAVADPLNPNVFDSITGLKDDLNVFNAPSVVASNSLVTYQFFAFTIGGGGNPPGTVVPDMPGRANINWQNEFFRNGMARSGDNIYACYHWPGNDDENLFVVRSGDGGLTWGAPVRVPADKAANTQFEGNGWNILVLGAGEPVLAGIDVEEDLVVLVGENLGADSTAWPAASTHRAEVLPQGTGRNFNVSAAANRLAPDAIYIAINRRETAPSTSNEVQLFAGTNLGIGTPLVSKVSANGGVVDDGPDASQSRFDVDVASDDSGDAHVVWYDAGTDSLEYRAYTGTFGPVEDVGSGSTFAGFTRPNITADFGSPYVTFTATGAEVVNDGEAVDADVWVTARLAGSWLIPVMVNLDAANLDEQESDICLFIFQSEAFVGIVWEAELGTNQRAIHFAQITGALDAVNARVPLTPDPVSPIDRLDPKIVGAEDFAVAIWEAKNEGPAGQGTRINF